MPSASERAQLCHEDTKETYPEAGSQYMKQSRADTSLRVFASFVLKLLLVVAIAAAVPPAALAQSYPTKPIRVLVAQAAGGPTDVVTRIYATRMTELLGQQVVVDNRPGAGGSVAGEIVARAPADGYTLCSAANGTIAIAPNFLKLSYNVTKDLAPIALIGNSPLALMVHPALPP